MTSSARPPVSSRRLVPVVACLCASTLVAFVAKSGSDATMPLFARDLSGSIASAGLQGSVFFGTSMLLRFVTGPLADARGNKPMMLGGMALLALAGFGAAVCAHIWQLLGVRALQAAGLAAFYPSAASLVGACAPAGREGLYMGVFRFAAVAPTMFGPSLFLWLVEQGGYRACFGALGLACLAALAVVLAGVPSDDTPVDEAPTDGAKAGLGARRLVQAYPNLFAHNARMLAIVFASAFVAAIGLTMLSSFAVLYAEGTGTPLDFGAFFVCLGMGGLVGNPLAGWAADRTNARHVIGGSLAAIALGIGLFAGMAQLGALAYASALLVGFGKSGATVGIMTLIARRVEPSSRTLAMALQQSCGDLGSACIMAVLGVAFQGTGFAAWPVLATAAVVLAAAALTFAAFRKPRRYR